MFGIEGIDAVEFGPGVLGVERAVDGGSGRIAFCNQVLDFPPQRILDVDPDLRHISYENPVW